MECYQFFNNFFMELLDNLKVIRGLCPMKIKAGFPFDILSHFCATLLMIYSLIGSQSCARRCSHSWS